jgi:hypothetical protein
MSDKTKVHKVVLLIVDHDNLGADGVKEEIECAGYANHCISPSIMDIETTEVEWDDDHPLNNLDTMTDEFEKLFPRK